MAVDYGIAGLFSGDVPGAQVRIAVLAQVAILVVHDFVDLLGPLDDWWGLLDLVAEDVSLDEVWKPDFQFVADVLLRWDGENLCGR